MSVFRVFPRLGMALAALAIALMVFMVYQADITRTSSARWVAHTQEVLGQLHEMNEGISRLGVAQLLFLLSSDDNFIGQRDRHLKRIQDDITDIETLTADNPAQQQRIREIRERLQKRYDYMRNTERIRREEGLTGNLYRTFLAGGRQETEAIQALASQMKAEEQRLLEARSTQAARLYHDELSILLTISIVSSVIMLIGFGFSRRQTHARERAERQLQVLADSLPGALYQARIYADRQETLLFLSAGVYRLAGHSDETCFQPSSWTEAVVPADRPGYLAALEAARAARSEFRHEYRLLGNDGHVRWVLHQATIKEQPDGSLLSHGYIYEITDQVELKRALQEAKDAAERANAAKSVFLATMSHEIRTPMNGVIGTLELLEHSHLDEEQRQNLRIVRSSSESLLRLLNDILDFSKIEAGKVEVLPEPVSLRRKLDNLYQLNVGYAARKGIRLRCHVDPDLSQTVLADPQLLGQILSNFLSNAIKFTSHGSVTLAADMIGRSDGIETVRLSVRDTGVGIKPEDQALLFDPFVQARGTPARAAGGTGLGLSICRRLAEFMGGTITLHSEPGIGTIVSVVLGLKIVDARDLPGSAAGEPSSATPEPARMPVRRPGHGAPVLIVDDHPINRIVLRKQVQQLGYAVECAVSGDEALEQWRTRAIGLILTDCNMPGMDGYTLTQRIRADEQATGRRHTPIIACTANAFEDAADACLACGMDDYVAKPITLERLREVLELWFPGDAPDAPGALLAIDMNRLRELSDGDPAVERQLLDQLRATNDADASAMKQAVATQDMTMVARSAHRMAGANMMVGALAFANACRAITQASRDEDAAAVAAALPAFDIERMRLDACLDQASSALQAAPMPTAGPALAPAANLSFLIVDDHPLQRHSLRMLLSQLGASRIAEAADGQAALARAGASDTPFDIIISDLDMPNMDGMELVRHLSRHPHSALILSSAHEPSLLASVATMAEAYGIRLLGVMEKPVERGVLEGLIARHGDLPPIPRPPDYREMQRYPLERIVEGIGNGEFEAFFQPKIEMATGRVTGAEALARWRHPGHGLVPPSAFIPQLEAQGPIERLTAVMLRQAVRACLACRAAGIPLTVAVNVSMRSLADVSMADQLTEIVQDEGGRPQDIVLEITETEAATNLAGELENLARIRIAGFGLAIDDYGTGYSSMQQLTNISFTELKIDRSFVAGAATRPSLRAALESSLTMAKKLRLSSVAEGVELQLDWDLLRQLGCDTAQGYYIARPMDLAAFLQWCRDRSASDHASAVTAPT